MVVINDGPRTVVLIEAEARNGDRSFLGGVRAGRKARPLIAPGQSVEVEADFSLPLAAAGQVASVAVRTDEGAELVVRLRR